MATEDMKKLNVRVSLKYDTYKNWYDNNPVLLAGEAAIATVQTTINNDPATGDNGLPLNPPTVLIKIGDGTTHYRDLSFISAKAADVLEACKSENGLTTFINNILKNANFADNAAITGLTGRMDDVEEAIEVLNGNDTTAGSVAKAIKDAIAALDLANTYAAKEHNHEIADVNGLQDALDGKQAKGDYAAAVHTHLKADITDFAHTHTKSEITDFAHTHTASEVTDLDATIKGYNYATKSEAQGYADAKDDAIEAAQKAGDDAMAEAQKKVASVAAGDASVTVAGTATAPTVAVKLDPSADNAIKLNANGLKVEIGAAPEYTIVKAADSGDYAAVYNLTKDGAIVGASINIPKDMVVKSGSVVGDEIVLVLNDEAATEIKIPVASLIEYVTSGSATGDMVVVNVSDDHKVTATITDGTITLAKLATDVRTAIGNAHSHENEAVLNGITAAKVEAWDKAEDNAKGHADGLNTAMNARVEALEKIDHEHKNFDLLETYTQTETDLADAVAKKHSHSFTDADVEDAIAKEHEHSNKTVLDGITATNITDWNDAVAKEHEHANKGVLDGITAEKVTAWDAAEQNAKDYADGLADNYATAGHTHKIDELTQDTNTYVIFDCGTSSINI